MRSSYATLMQSKYFNPAFNSAIFDGPIRIYFAQFHEAFALKVYFLVQQKLSEEFTKARQTSKESGANILVMVYPTSENFSEAFSDANTTALLEIDHWQENVVIGLRGPTDDRDLDQLMETLRLTMNTWSPAPWTSSTALMQM
ncbi:MAG: hypothetical protein ACXVCY_06275 [Pseudobdellovibrionaceae bacterium]